MAYSLVTAMMRAGAVGSSVGAANLTASGHFLAGIYMPIPGKTISKIGAYCTAATGSPVVDIQLESLTSFVPSGSLIATGASLTGQSVSASTFYQWTLTTPYVVPSGTTLVAAVIRYVSGTTVNFNLRNTIGTTGIPRVCQNQGSDSTTAATPMISIIYSDGTVGYSCAYQTTVANLYNSTTSPDEYGNRFTAPMNCAVVGLRDFTRINNTSASVLYRIYDASLNVLTTDAELTIGQYHHSSGAAQEIIELPTRPIYLNHGATYYITRTAVTSGSGTAFTQTVTFPDTAHKEAIFSDFSLATRTDGTGAFTIDTSKLEMLVPIISGSFSSKISAS